MELSDNKHAWRAGRISFMAEGKTIDVYFDALPNWLSMDGPQKELTARQLIEGMHKRIDDGREAMLERFRKSKAFIVHMGAHVPMLVEARELFVEGRYYPCVAMCGITAERIFLDLFEKTLTARVGDKLVEVNEPARRALVEHGIWRVVVFLREVGVIDQTTKKSAQKLIELRNEYAHAGGKNAETDAEKALQLLHEVIEGTVSVFKDYIIKKGKFVPKAVASKQMDEGAPGAKGTS
jgi:hypothetical protein